MHVSVCIDVCVYLGVPASSCLSLPAGQRSSHGDAGNTTHKATYSIVLT